MTPTEIFEYKMTWLPGVQVAIHSDMRSQAKDWCKQWMNPIHWKHTQHTNVYEDTFHFQHMRQAKGLVSAFPEYAKIIED